MSKIEEVKCSGCGELRSWVGTRCLTACSCSLNDNEKQSIKISELQFQLEKAKKALKDIRFVSEDKGGEIARKCLIELDGKGVSNGKED